MAQLTDIQFNAQGLLPAIVQDAKSKQVLMMAWMNIDSLKLTQETGLAHFWSRSRQKLWRKGETSGNTLTISTIRLDCDGDTLLLTVNAAGPACHTGNTSCFFRYLEK